MLRLIKKYKDRIKELKKEYEEHRENDAYKTYIYGKILTYQLVVRDLRELERKNRND